MIVRYTQDELNAQEQLIRQYEEKLENLNKLIDELAPKPFPDTDAFFEGISATKNPEAWKSAIAKENAAYTEWEETGSAEWRAAETEKANLVKRFSYELGELLKEAEKRQFAELNGNIAAIAADFQKQVIALIQSLYDDEKRDQTRLEKVGGGYRQSIYAVSLGESAWLLEPTSTRRAIRNALRLHYDAVKDNEPVTQAFDAYITGALENSPYVASDGTGEIFGKILIKNHEPQNRYRTRSSAAPDVIREMPLSLAIPTLHNYEYATSLYANGYAYMQKLTSTDGLKFQNGKIFFEGDFKAITEAELQNMKTKEGIAEIDLGLLRIFYSIILTTFEKSGYREIKPIITLYMPDMAEYIGLQRNLNKQKVTGIIEKVQSFHNIVGVLHEIRNGKSTQSLYPVLNFEGYNDKTNTISFSSPYMNNVIQTLRDVAVKRSKTTKPKLKKHEEALINPKPYTSYLVKSEILKEKNKAAIENVIIVVTLIEQAGKTLPHISASTMIERNPQLQQRLKESKNPSQLLSRTFKKTWELLRNATKLSEKYKEIQLPDPNNPATIPTLKNLNSISFIFPHKGKIKPEEEELM